MKIYGTDPLGKLKELVDRSEQSEKGSKTREGGTAGASATSATPGTDSVELSPEVKELGTLREALLDTPEVRQELVDRLRSEIASGRYRVDGSRVAEGLLAEGSFGGLSLVNGSEGDGEVS